MKSTVRVNQQLETIHSSFVCGTSADNVFADTCNEFPIDVEEDFVDCEASYLSLRSFMTLKILIPTVWIVKKKEEIIWKVI